VVDFRNLKTGSVAKNIYGKRIPGKGILCSNLKQVFDELNLSFSIALFLPL